VRRLGSRLSFLKALLEYFSPNLARLLAYRGGDLTFF